MKRKQTVVLDFDGVVNSYRSAWSGLETIPDPPVQGIEDAVRENRDAGYDVVVVSARCRTEGGIKAVREYLWKNNIEVDGVEYGKPPALCYVDDRAICFTGHPECLLEQIRKFKPWNRK